MYHDPVEKLIAIGGGESLKLSALEWNIRVRLNWHKKAKSAVRHILNRERKIDWREARDIDAAYIRYCAEKVLKNAAETKALYDTLRASIAAMEASDPEFFGPDIEAIGAMLLQARNQVAENG